ncbi:hypothetical protein DH09_11715 [Bacillaceae bacterium JMAK1]|nr:hypothetical protein DH09_11715 [Bacillaceae bacterium JMAK1]
MLVYAIGVLVSFAIYMLIGTVLSRRVSNVEDYYVSGRNASTLMITGSLVASFLSTVAFMGEAGFAYDGYPITLLILTIFNASGYVLGVLLFGRYLRRSNAITLPEYFGKRFNSKRVQRVAGLTTIVGISAYLVAVTQGGALLLSRILEVQYPVALIIVWVVYTSFTFMSGAKGVLVNDTLMFFIFSLATFIGIPYIIYAAGGWPEAIVATANLDIKPDLLSWHGLTGDTSFMGTPIEVLGYAVILGLVWGTVVSVSPWQTSRYLMAKSEHVAIRAGIVAMISLMAIYLFLHIGITTVNLINPDINPSENVFIWAAINIMPTWIGVIVLTGIMAATLSSASTFLQLIGNSFSNDLFYLKLSDKKALSFSRMSMLALSVVTLLITLGQPPAIMWIGYFAATLFAASWGPVAFASIYSKRVNGNGAFWSIVIGFFAVIGAEIFQAVVVELPIFLHPVVIGVILSTLTLVVFAKVGEVTDEEIVFRNQLLRTPKEFFNKSEVKITRRYVILLFISGILMVAATFFFYFYPVYIL